MTGSVLHSISQVGLVLILMVGLIFSLAWLAKKTQAFGLQGGKHMSLLQTLPLGQKEKAVLIEIHGKKILLGVTAGQVSTLWVSEAWIDNAADAKRETHDEVASSDVKTDGVALVGMDFSSTMKKFLAKNILSKEVAC